MRFPWSKASPEPEKADALTIDERVKAIESRMDTLLMDWEDVLSKLARRAGREAMRAKVDLLKTLERPDTPVVSGANGTDEAGTEEYMGPPGVGFVRGPTKEALRRKMQNLRRA